MSKTEELILKNTNELLRSVGVASKKIVHFSELQKSASSMFVAIFETMFQVKLKGVIRKPSHVKDYEHNAQAVITALGKSILSMDLSHISGASIVNGDTHSIMNLVDIFVGISEVWLKRRFQNDALGRSRKTLSKQLKGKVPSLNLEGLETGGGSGGGGGVNEEVAEGGKSSSSAPTSKPSSDAKRNNGDKRSKNVKTSGKNRPKTAKRPASARGPNDIHRSIANMASAYPAMWRSLSERGTLRKGDNSESSQPTRLQRLEKRHFDEREARQKSEYKRLLQDRLVSLRRKDILEAKKQVHRARGAMHNEKVRGIKLKQQADVMRRQSISFRLRRKTQAETRIRKLYLSMIKSLHDTKREAEVDDKRRLESMKTEGGARAQALDAFFAERLAMVERHLGESSRERDMETQAQEGQIRELLRELKEDSAVRIDQKLERAKTLEEEELRRGAEATLALAQVIGVEDWEGLYKERFMTPLISEVNRVKREIEGGGAGRAGDMEEDGGRDGEGSEEGIGGFGGIGGIAKGRGKTRGRRNPRSIGRMKADKAREIRRKQLRQAYGTGVGVN